MKIIHRFVHDMKRHEKSVFEAVLPHKIYTRWFEEFRQQAEGFLKSIEEGTEGGSDFPLIVFCASKLLAYREKCEPNADLPSLEDVMIMYAKLIQKEAAVRNRRGISKNGTISV